MCAYEGAVHHLHYALVDQEEPDEEVSSIGKE